MPRVWLVPCLLLSLGCSDGPVPSGFLDRESEPRLLLRCEEGLIGAYITVGPAKEAETGAIPEGAVPVQLDSMPSC